MGNACKRGWAPTLLLAGALTLALAGPAPAAVTERITDGGFEATTCPPPPHTPESALECVNPIWPEEYEQGFACRMPPCGPGPASGSGFFSFGGLAPFTAIYRMGITQQMVEIPTAPAILTFKLERQPTDIGGRFEIALDDRVLKEYEEEIPATYETQTLDLSTFVRPGLRELSLQYICYLGPDTSRCPVYNLDDVSLKTGSPDPFLPSPAGPTAPTVTPPADQTPPVVKPKALKCKKGFRKKLVKGKKRCVRKRKARKGRR